MNRRIICKFICTMLTIAFMSIGATKAFASSIVKFSDKTVKENKVWAIKFNFELDSNTINNSVIVKDSLGNKIDTDVKLIEDRKTILVSPPNNGYEHGKSYTLVVEDNIKSIYGKELKEGASVNFDISNNTSSGNNSSSTYSAKAKVEVSPATPLFKVITIKSTDVSNAKGFKIEGNNNLFQIGKSAFSIVNEEKVTIYFYGEDGTTILGKGILDVSKTADNVDIQVEKSR